MDPDWCKKLNRRYMNVCLTARGGASGRKTQRRLIQMSDQHLGCRGWMRGVILRLCTDVLEIFLKKVDSNCLGNYCEEQIFVKCDWDKEL